MKEQFLNVKIDREMFPILDTVFTSITKGKDANDMEFKLDITPSLNKAYNIVYVSIDVSAVYYPNGDRDFSDMPNGFLVKDIASYGFEFDRYASYNKQLEVIKQADRNVASILIRTAMYGIDWLNWKDIITGDAPIDHMDKRIPNVDF
jgi:hypothetical protein